MEITKDVSLGTFLDEVDKQSVHQRAMHEHLADAFLSLARESYCDNLSAARKWELVNCIAIIC